jgi:2-polyprenyl-6-methoxyphenol hydroxylase-like FAD-dependent oxidoreductase
MLFIGAGAIGSYLGAFLARAGHDVTLVDPWPEQIAAGIAGAERSVGLVMSKIGVALWKGRRGRARHEAGAGRGSRRLPRGRARWAHHRAGQRASREHRQH